MAPNPLTGSEAWLSTMGKRSFTRCHIRRSAFYHRPTR